MTDDNQIASEYLVTEKTIASVADKLDREGIFTKPYTADTSDGLKTVGLRVGQRPDHVVAYFGDTLRRNAQGRISVWRMTEIKPPPSLTWHVVNPDEEAAAERIAFEEEQARIRATCRCASPAKDQYTLEIVEGSIEIRHTPCGKRPWFMFDDWTESVSMSPQRVHVDVNTKCSGPECYSESCDCGPEIYVKTPEGQW